MSTRSCIAVERCNGAVSEIYCHSDGEIRNVGERLLTYYRTTRQAAKLITLGDIAVLGTTPDISNTVAYMRDKDCVECYARKHRSVKRFQSLYEVNKRRYDQGYEYMYLLTRKHGWLVKQYADPWESLAAALITEKLSK